MANTDSSPQGYQPPAPDVPGAYHPSAPNAFGSYPPPTQAPQGAAWAPPPAGYPGQQPAPTYPAPNAYQTPQVPYPAPPQPAPEHPGKARLAGIGTMALGVLILIAFWAIMQFAHRIFIWAPVIGAILVISGIVQTISGKKR